MTITHAIHDRRMTVDFALSRIFEDSAKNRTALKKLELDNQFMKQVGDAYHQLLKEEAYRVLDTGDSSADAKYNGGGQVLFHISFDVSDAFRALFNGKFRCDVAQSPQFLKGVEKMLAERLGIENNLG